LDQGHDNDLFSPALIDLVQLNPYASRSVLQRLADNPGKAMRENALRLLQFCEEDKA
jgi:hypothetical protein